MSSSIRYVVILAATLLLSCGVSDEDEDASADDSWECTSEREGWEQCDGGSVIWCHAVAHGDLSDAHFHEGANCEQDGLQCVELDEQVAACSDPASTCEPGFAECAERDARNCLDGQIASMRCPLAETCEVTAEGARCITTSQE